MSMVFMSGCFSSKNNNIPVNGLEYFPASYQTARINFLKAAENADTHESFPVFKDLTMDLAVYHVENRETLLVLCSGTHGIEGYAGHAAQRLFMDNFQSHLKSSTGLLLIHAVNPFGFHYRRRVNENNVDLNRTFIIQHETAQNTDNKKLEAIFSDIYQFLTPQRPLKNVSFSTFSYYTQLILKGLRYGITPMKNAIAGGQYQYPDSLFYGGNNSETSKEKSEKIIETVLKKHTAGYKNMVLIDIHTGTGKSGALYLTHHGQDSKAFRKLKKIIPELESNSINTNFQNKTYSYKTNGTFIEYADRISAAADNYCLVIDLCTGVHALTLLNLMIRENQIYKYPQTPAKIKNNILKKFSEAYYPTSIKKRNEMLNTCYRFFQEIGNDFHLFK